MTVLKVPLAKEHTGKFVSPENAKKENKYFCPNCGDLLIFRKGSIKKSHFAHKNSDVCSNESIMHKLGKHLIKNAIDEFINKEADSPEIKRSCYMCGEYCIQHLPPRITSSEFEVKLKSGFIADVVIKVDNDIVAAVEVKVTHEVSNLKKQNIGVPFIELSGDKIIENPMHWKPRIDRFKPYKCSKCDKELNKFKNNLLRISKNTKTPIPKELYRTTYIKCWKCYKQILVFTWPGKEDNAFPKLPRPKTVQLRYSKQAGVTKWSNTCPHCNCLQGDYFLFCSEGPFLCFQCTDSFIFDMHELAYRTEVYFK